VSTLIEAPCVDVANVGLNRTQTSAKYQVADLVEVGLFPYEVVLIACRKIASRQSE
jgi:hypothetical protein